MSAPVRRRGGVTWPRDQHWCSRLDQLLGLGLSRVGRPEAGRRRAPSSHPPRRLLPRPAGQLLLRAGAYLAAVLACGPDAVLSHRSAAGLHGAPASQPLRGSTSSCPAAATARSPASPSIARRPSPPPTSPGRTVSPARPSPAPSWTSPRRRRLQQIERALNQAEVMGCSTSARSTISSRRNPARARARRSCAPRWTLYQPGHRAHRERLEDAFVELMPSAAPPGARSARCGSCLDDGEEPFRADFVWRAQRVVLETDGRAVPRDAHALRGRPPPGPAARPRRVAGRARHLAPAAGTSPATVVDAACRTLAGVRRPRRGRRPRPPAPLAGLDQPLAALQAPAPPRRRPACESSASGRPAAAGLTDQRGHLHAVEPAGDDPRERLEVVLDVDRPAVGGHAARDVDADRRDLAVLHPDAGVVRAVLGARPRAGHALGAQRRHQAPLQRAHVRHDVIDRARSDSRRADRGRGR